VAVDHQHVILSFVGRRLLGAHGARKLPLRGVVFKQISEVVRWHDVAHGDDVEGRAKQTLFDESAEDEAADTTETINCDFDCHERSSVEC
jgi:hypothetical protein